MQARCRVGILQRTVVPWANKPGPFGGLAARFGHRSRVWSRIWRAPGARSVATTAAIREYRRQTRCRSVSNCPLFKSKELMTRRDSQTFANSALRCCETRVRARTFSSTRVGVRTALPTPNGSWLIAQGTTVLCRIRRPDIGLHTCFGPMIRNDPNSLTAECDPETKSELIDRAG